MTSSTFTGYFNSEDYKVCLGRGLERVGSQSRLFLLSAKLSFVLICPGFLKVTQSQQTYCGSARAVKG